MIREFVSTKGQNWPQLKPVRVLQISNITSFFYSHFLPWLNSISYAYLYCLIQNLSKSMKMVILTLLGFGPGPEPYRAWTNLDLSGDETSHLRHCISSFLQSISKMCHICNMSESTCQEWCFCTTGWWPVWSVMLFSLHNTRVMHIRHFLLLFENDSLGSNSALAAHKVLQISLLPFVISTLMIFRWFRTTLQKVWMIKRPFYCHCCGMFKKGDGIKKYSYKL